MPPEEMRKGAGKRGKLEDDVEVEVMKPPRRSTESVHRYLHMVGECALEGRIDVEELYRAVKDGDLKRFLRMAEEHVYLKRKNACLPKLQELLTALQKIVNSEAFQRYLSDPAEQSRHAAEIFRRLKRCPNCGRYLNRPSCRCGWSAPPETGEKPTPIPVHAYQAKAPWSVLIYPYRGGVLVNPHHPLIRAIKRAATQG